jgi:hypothetical protein
VNIDTPVAIGGRPTPKATKFEAWNSTALYEVGYQGQINSEDNSAEDYLTFTFVWTNDTGQIAYVANPETLLVVQGHGDPMRTPTLGQYLLGLRAD